MLEGVPLPAGTRLTDLRLTLVHEGAELLAYQPQVVRRGDPPPPATEPPPPTEIGSLEELWLTGMHLQQYRHATRRPEDYYREALRRDPHDSRANTAMGEWYLRRGQYAEAERHLRAALERLTIRNGNPRDGEASYLLGLGLRLAGRLLEADTAFGKALWNGAYGAAANTARAEIAAAEGRAQDALAFIERALAANASEPLALGLKMALLRRAGRLTDAREVVAATLAADPLDVRALHEQSLLEADRTALPGGAQTALDIAHDEARAGLLEEAVDVLVRALEAGPQPGHRPLLHYTLAWIEARRGEHAAARTHRRLAAAAAPAYALPVRLEEIEVLEWAIGEDPDDARAPYYLGCLLYDKRRYEEAITCWRRAARLDPAFPTVHRNLGIAEFNVLDRPERALASYRRAHKADPADARVLYELDQLRKRLAHDPPARLRSLEAERATALRRDDLTVELVTLLNLAGRYDEALEVLRGRRFHPWEGGEGLVSAQWVVAHRELARAALAAGDADAAIDHALSAMEYPQNLGEGKHLLTPENELQLLLGRSLRASGRAQEADVWLRRATEAQGDPAAPTGDGPYWQALALRELGQAEAAHERLAALADSAAEQATTQVRIPYFATSLPTLLLFDDDLSERARQEALYLEGLVALGRGRTRAAVTSFQEAALGPPGPPRCTAPPGGGCFGTLAGSRLADATSCPRRSAGDGRHDLA